MSFIKFENIVKLFTKYWEKFLVTGVSYTLLLAAITVAFGAVIACLLAGIVEYLELLRFSNESNTIPSPFSPKTIN